MGGSGMREMMGGMREMMGGGMMPGMMGGPGGRLSEAEEKAKLKTMTRTDFLLQFVWVPLKPEEQPKTEEEFKAKIEEIAKAMHEAEKNNPAVTMPKPEEIEAVSLKQSQQIDSALSKAVSPPAPGAAGGGAPVMVPPPGGGAPAPGGPGATGTQPPPK